MKGGNTITTKFYDTCALLASVNVESMFHENFLISSVTLYELESIKTSKIKSENIKYNARKLSRLLDQYHDKYNIIHYNNDISKYINTDLALDSSIPDNQIIGTALYIRKYTNKDILFVTNDLCLKNIAHCFNLPIESIQIEENIYKGYTKIEGTAEQINDFIEHIDFSNWNVNEYIIIKNTDDNSEKEMRFDGEKFVSLKLPPSKYIKAKNSLQRCALDILNNQDITIAAILGGYGSGKSFLSMQMGLYHVLDKGSQNSILGVRSPIGEGKEIGFLPGDMNNKIQGFFEPLVQQLNGGEFELESLKQRGVIDCNIPYYMKGTTYNNTIMIVDEAEDLDEKQIRLIGTRVGQNSRIFFSGDYKQSVIDSTNSNALVKMCNEFKGMKEFATIYLGEDVRSYTSKMFANLFQE